MASADPRTLLLFCPYDKKVTRHARRGPKMQMVCMDCGRGVDADPDEPATVKAPRSSRRERTIGAPPEIPDLAEVLAASVLGPPPARPRRTSASRAVVDRPAPRATSDPPRRPKRPRAEGSPGWHPVLIIAIAFFAVLALANVVGNLLGGRGDEAAAPTTPEVATFSGRIVNTDGQGVYIRRTPNLDDRLPTAIGEGERIRVFGPERIVQNDGWRQVEDPDGVHGWVPARYVAVD